MGLTTICRLWFTIAEVICLGSWVKYKECHLQLLQVAQKNISNILKYVNYLRCNGSHSNLSNLSPWDFGIFTIPDLWRPVSQLVASEIRGGQCLKQHVCGLQGQAHLPKQRFRDFVAKCTTSKQKFDSCRCLPLEIYSWADAGGVVLTVIGNVANKLRISMGFMDFIICDQETRGIIIWLGLESDWVKNRQETAIKMGNMTPAGWRLGYFEFLVEVGPLHTQRTRSHE
jgi:hypothetical protein